jgi:hypothetical protein
MNFIFIVYLFAIGIHGTSHIPMMSYDSSLMKCIYFPVFISEVLGHEKFAFHAFLGDVLDNM